MKKDFKLKLPDRRYIHMWNSPEISQFRGVQELMDKQEATRGVVEQEKADILGGSFMGLELMGLVKTSFCSVYVVMVHVCTLFKRGRVVPMAWVVNLACCTLASIAELAGVPRPRL